MKNSNTVPEQIDLQTVNVSTSDISNNTSNSDNTLDLLSEHNLVQSKETKSQVSNSIKLPEDVDNDSAEILNFVKRISKERSKDDLASKLDQSKIKSPCPEPKLSTDQADTDSMSLQNLKKTLLNSIFIKQILNIPVDIDLTPSSLPHLTYLFGKAEKTG
ncbi:hypothetical protein Glove_202g56 [Diversispora epigaea]|uniref:Uncharacterized protein n=1 Tax=Diversispora epigaea TaxID=1348612 RepID=A0A397IJE9_9GLOM|nr:hypothetical protein Glove_202g56 [Diversispora epigaea]